MEPRYELQDFQSDIILQSHQIPVVVDFWAPWCGPCRTLGPTLERLAEEHKGEWTLIKVNTENNPELAQREGIRSIPHVRLYYKGAVLDQFTGALPEPMILQWLKKALPDKFQDRYDTSLLLLRDGRDEEAARLLEAILESDPANPRARSLLANTLVFRDPERAIALVEDLHGDPEYSEQVETVVTFGPLLRLALDGQSLPDNPVRTLYHDACIALGRKDFRTALEKFIEVIRQNRHYDNDGSRKACIAIFRFLGEEHELTQEFRRPFGSALFI